MHRLQLAPCPALKTFSGVESAPCGAGQVEARDDINHGPTWVPRVDVELVVIARDVLPLLVFNLGSPYSPRLPLGAGAFAVDVIRAWSCTLGHPRDVAAVRMHPGRISLRGSDSGGPKYPPATALDLCANRHRCNGRLARSRGYSGASWAAGVRWGGGRFVVGPDPADRSAGFVSPISPVAARANSVSPFFLG